jgi:DNA transformation protein
MTRDDGFIDYLHELLDPLGQVSTRRMFGGHGVYVEELFMAIVIDGRLYLKVDAETRARFEEAGCEPFVYTAKDAPVTMSYWSAPESAMDSAEEMASWAKLAIEAAARKPAPKKRPATKVPAIKAPAKRRRAK